MFIRLHEMRTSLYNSRMHFKTNAMQRDANIACVSVGLLLANLLATPYAFRARINIGYCLCCILFSAARIIARTFDVLFVMQNAMSDRYPTNYGATKIEEQAIKHEAVQINN